MRAATNKKRGIAALLVAAALSAGCQTQKTVVRDSWGSLRDLSDSSPDKPQAEAASKPAPKAPERTADKLDLKQFAGMYSLQIGFYDEDFGPGFRKAAEEAAATLRRDGDEAYYYHGPIRSMVTIGLFTESDFVNQDGVQSYGPRIMSLQKKYPYNLGNGLTQVQKIGGVTLGEQMSFIVKIPTDAGAR